MKSKYVLAGLLALSMVSVAYVATVAATDDYYPHLRPTPSGVTWQFSTTEPIEGWSFSGKDIIKDTVEAFYWATDVPEKEIPIQKIITTDKLVTLVFDPADLPAYAVGNSVSGTLTNDDTFLASGPGFAWGGHT